MEIQKNQQADALTLKVIGCLDTATSPELQAEFDTALEGVTKLTLDFSALDYISSAGFRVLLVANKRLKASGGTMSLIGVSPAVREVFDMTGFSDIFTIS